MANAGIILALNLVLGSISATALMVIGIVYYLGTLIPDLSLSVRRMHDIGKSGWALLLGFIPIAGAIILLVFAAKESAPANQWGEPAKN